MTSGRSHERQALFEEFKIEAVKQITERGHSVYDAGQRLGVSASCSREFVSTPKRERIRCKTYKAREEAMQDIFNYVGMFYNPIRGHGNSDDLSQVEFERRHFMKQQVPR
jgi:transposase InsO family protein